MRMPNMPAPVVWLTGLSGSGKTTIGREVCRELERRGMDVEYLDGDVIRSVFPNTGFARADRDAHIRRIGFLASRLERHGVAVVVALVSPYRDSRAFARALCRNFIEVHVSTPLPLCEARDVKGLYAKARRGEIRHFTGTDDPYEPPVDPELVVDTTDVTVEDAVRRVMQQVDGAADRGDQVVGQSVQVSLTT
jgi:adenylylsulfate kinase